MATRRNPVELNRQLCRASARELLALVGEASTWMNSVNCATALHRLAKAETPPASDLGTLCDRTAAVLRSEARLTGRSVASIAWAVGKLRISHDPLLAALTSAAHARVRSLDGCALANIAWALAGVRDGHVADGALLEALADAAAARVDEISAQARYGPGRDLRAAEMHALRSDPAIFSRAAPSIFPRFAGADKPRMGVRHAQATPSRPVRCGCRLCSAQARPIYTAGARSHPALASVPRDKYTLHLMGE